MVYGSLGTLGEATHENREPFLVGNELPPVWV